MVYTAVTTDIYLRTVFLIMTKFLAFVISFYKKCIINIVEK